MVQVAKISRACVDDAEIISLLGRLTFVETFGYLFNNHKDDLDEYLDQTFNVCKITASLKKEENTLWLARWDGLPIGYAKFKNGSTTAVLPKRNVGQLQKIYVLRQFLFRGAGALLLKEVLAHAESREALTVWLAVLAANTTAIGFYEKHGFNRTAPDSYSIGAQTFKFTLMSRSIWSDFTI